MADIPRTVRLPASPLAAPAAPAPPLGTVVLPVPPVSLIPGHTVPIVFPFIRADLTGGGALLTVSLASASAPGVGSGSGQLSSEVQAHWSSAADFETGATATARIEAGAGAMILVSADFGGIGATRATDANTRGAGELSVTSAVQVDVPASFHSSSATVGVIYAPLMPLTAQMTGAGSLTAAAIPGFSSSGMNKDGTQTGPNTTNAWVPLINWTADTANYPGSTVDTHALVSQGGKEAATISSSISWARGGWASNSISVRLKLNDTVIVTGTTANPATATTTVAVAPGDRITVEIKDAGSFASVSQATIIAAGTYTRIT